MIVYGVNPVLEALRAGAGRISRLHLREGKLSGRLREIVRLARQRGVPLRFEPPAILEKKASSPRHQGAVAELAEVEYRRLDDLLSTSPDLLLLVDGIEDPQNLGALIRTAEAAGVGGILLPDRHSCGITPAVVKASAGAALLTPIVQVGNLVQTLKKLKEAGFWSVGLDMEGATAPWELDDGLPLVLIVGSEHRGLRRLVKENCDFLVGLPMLGRVSSLNLSVAAGVLMYFVVWKRRFKP